MDGELCEQVQAQREDDGENRERDGEAATAIHAIPQEMSMARARGASRGDLGSTPSKPTGSR